MIFASDLDQTLIYSKRAFRLPDSITNPEVKLVEMMDDQEISFMTIKAIALLEEVAKKMLFIPVTTRTMEQYRRIFLFHKKIIPPYAVTSNGGNIIINGSIDADWSHRIVTLTNENSLTKEDMLSKFSEIQHEQWVHSVNTADDLFCYCIVDQKAVPHDELTSFKRWLDSQGWNVSLQGRKLYFVPKHVNKWDAVHYLKELTNETFVATAGDSLLDLCMLNVSDYAIAPLHGELYDADRNDTRHINRTGRAGIFAAEDILESVLSVTTAYSLEK